MKQFKVSWLDTVTKNWVSADKIKATDFEEARTKIIDQVKQAKGIKDEDIEKQSQGLLIKSANQQAIIMEDKNAL